MAMSLVDDRLTVDLARARVLGDLDRLRAEPHRAAEILDLLLLRQQVDYGVVRLGIHLGRVRAIEAEHVTGELGDRDVHAEADTQVRDLALAGNAAGQDLPFPAAGAEAARHEHAVDLLEQRGRFFQGHPFRIDPAHLDLRTVMCACMLQRLVNREVRVLQLHVFADQCYLDDLFALLHALVEVEPVTEVRFRGR